MEPPRAKASCAGPRSSNEFRSATCQSLVVAGPAIKRATYEDVLSAPAHLVAQILDGVLVTLPRQAAPHVRAASTLGIDIGGPFDRQRGGPGGWHILDEPELHLAADILVPDLAGWRRERLPSIPRAAFFTLAPDWACEVLSPSTAGIDRGPKMSIYARENVPHVWLVDPGARLGPGQPARRRA